MDSTTVKASDRNPMNLSAILNSSTDIPVQHRNSLRSISASSTSTGSPKLTPPTPYRRLPPISNFAKDGLDCFQPPMESQAGPTLRLPSINSFSIEAPSISQGQPTPQPLRGLIREESSRQASYQGFLEAQSRRKSPSRNTRHSPPRRTSFGQGSSRITAPFRPISASPFQSRRPIAVSAPHKSPSSTTTRRRSTSPRSTDEPRAHSNKAYDVEQVDWMRYFKEDKGGHWDDQLGPFKNFFADLRESGQCLSSRYYRDNAVPAFRNVAPSSSTNPDGGDDDFELVFKDGKPLWIQAKVRERTSPKGKEDAIPYTLVEKHPERAVTYTWVSEEHKLRARDIMREDREMERTGTLTKQGRWRKIIRKAEALKPRK